MSLFARKPLSRIMSEAEGGSHTLRKELTATQLVMLGIGAIIGAGLFTLTGPAAAQHAGPAIMLSFVVAALGCAFAGLCYSEFASMIPVAGSAYTYSYATMGELLAWIIGWDLVLEYAVGASTVAVSWTGYVVSFLRDFGIHFPLSLAASPLESLKIPFTNPPIYAEGFINLPALLAVVMISTLLIIGVKESASVNAVMVTIKLLVIVLFIAFCWGLINPANHVPLIPENTTGEFGRFGFTGIIRGAGIIFFAYIGFDAVSTAAQDARRPQRDMPIGIIGSLIICTIIYIIFTYVLTGVVNYRDLNDRAAVALAIDRTPHQWLKSVVKLGVIAGYTSVMLVMLFGQSRVFYSMSRDGLLPKLFSDIHPKFRTPWRSNLVFMLFVSLMAAFLPLAHLGEMTSIGTLFAFVLVCAGVMVMRKTHPDLPRPFRTPLVPVVPVLGILVNLYLMYGLGAENWIRLFVWLFIGLAIYFGYSRHHSRLKTEPVTDTLKR